MDSMLGRLFVWARKQSGTFKWLFFIVLGILVGLNIFLIHPHHPHVEIEKVAGFWAVFGLGIALCMIVVVKKIIAHIVDVPEDFYERHD